MANSGMLMVMYSMASGRMTRPMGMVFMCMSTVQSMKETGWMISNTDKVWRCGQMAPHLRETTNSDRRTVLERTSGPIIADTQAIGTTTRSMER